jgi:hypothetical protein
MATPTASDAWPSATRVVTFTARTALEPVRRWLAELAGEIFGPLPRSWRA